MGLYRSCLILFSPVIVLLGSAPGASAVAMAQEIGDAAEPQLVLELIRANRLSEAAELIKRMPAEKGAGYTAHYLRGMLETKRNNIGAAVASFKKAIALNASYVEAHWALSRMYMAQKRWVEAVSALETVLALESLDSVRRGEARYSLAVATYFSGHAFAARSQLTEILWDNDSAAATVSAARNFLQDMEKERRWSFVVPMGLQYDGNPLELAADAPLPGDVESRQAWSAYAGVLGTYAVPGGEPRSGWSLESALVGQRNVDRGYGDFDALQAGVTAAHVDEPAPGVRTAERFGMSFLRFGSGLGFLRGQMELGRNAQSLAVGGDVQLGATGAGERRRNNDAWLEVRWKPQLALSETITFGGEGKVQGRYAFGNGHVNENSVVVGVAPSVSFVPSPRFVFDLRLPQEFTLGLGGPARRELRTGASASAVVFLMPSLLTSLSGGIDRVSTREETANHPRASVGLTAMF